LVSPWKTAASSWTTQGASTIGWPFLLTSNGRVRGIGKAHSTKFTSPFKEAEEANFKNVTEAQEKVSVYFEDTGRIDIPLYQLDELQAGDQVRGPAIILQNTQTTVLEPKATAKVLQRHVMIELER
jgi:5-oxoprolinase (ATP-hydrolysing)